MKTPAQNARRTQPTLAVTALFGLMLVIACALLLPKKTRITFDPHGHPKIFGVIFENPKLHRAVFQTLDILNFRFKFRLPQDFSRDATINALPVMDQAMRLGSARQDASDWNRIRTAALQRLLSDLAKELEQTRQDELNLLRKLNPPPPLMASQTDEAAYVAMKQRKQQLLLVRSRFSIQLDAAQVEAQRLLNK